MDNNERLNGALQENILTVLCFDDENCKLIRAAVSPQLFESSVFREVAGHALDFIDQFGEAIKDHLPDHLEGILLGEDKRKADTYKRLVDNLYATKDSVNAEYVVSQLHKFVRMQKLKDGVIKAVEALEDGRVDEAEVQLQETLKGQSISFEGGLNLGSLEDLMGILDTPEEEGFDLGIKELDDFGVIPRRKELLAFMAARGKGKSWFAIHAVKQAILQRWSSVVISLEMSERRYGARFLQSFFSISRRTAVSKVTRIINDEEGNISDLVQEEIERPTMKDSNIRQVIAKRGKREFNKRAPLRFKAFPTKALNMAGLKAYLEGLERLEKFSPDLLVVDYPGLMNLDSKNLRIDLGNVVAELRGLAVERNMAVIILHQGNREAETAALVTGGMSSEDISVLATADTLLTYSQTLAEYKMGLARLFVEKARNEEAKQQILISQNYNVGQFCLDSASIHSEYWQLLDDKGAPRRKRQEGE